MMPHVITIFASLIAVAGTLLGSLSTYMFQRRTALHSETAARRERFRQDRLSACGEFAAAVTEVKRAVITAWFRRETRDDDWLKAMTEADSKGSAAEGAMIKMLLLIDDADLRKLAEDFSEYVGVVRRAANKADLEACEPSSPGRD
jgi:hypothetical protein